MEGLHFGNPKPKKIKQEVVLALLLNKGLSFLLFKAAAMAS